MLEITRKNCYKCNLETVIDNNSQYFWINLRDFEVETESKWLNIFNKHGDKSTLNYRRELTPNIKFQAEFLMFKEKLGICLYEENYYEEEIIKIQDEESFKIIGKVSNEKSTKKLIEESGNESIEKSDNESIQEMFEEIDKESEEELIEDLKEPFSLNK